MIDKISQLLYQNELAHAESRLRYNFLLTQGTCIVAEVTGTKGEAFFIKFSELSDLEEEFGRLEHARRSFREFVPKQYGHFRQSQFNLIISERVQHSSISASAILDRSKSGLGVRIEQYFSDSKGARSAATVRDPATDIVSEAFDYLRHNGLEASVLESIDTGLVPDMPSVPQHGDFVLNNLGKRRNSLYIFDWEDYGKVTLPGLDLATLVFSIADFEAQHIRRVIDEGAATTSALAGLVKRCCARSSIDHSRFLGMLPLHLALFLYLKREYGPKVQSVVRNCLVELQGH